MDMAGLGLLAATDVSASVGAFAGMLRGCYCHSPVSMVD